MKKLSNLLLGVILLFTFAACTKNQAVTEEPLSSTTITTSVTMGNPSATTTQEDTTATPVTTQSPQSTSQSVSGTTPKASTIGNQSTTKQPTPSTTNRSQEDAKKVVIYFSVPETTSVSNMTKEEDNSVVVIDGKVLGNTQYVAQLIQRNTDADLFRIEPKMPYPTDHKTLVDLASDEQAKRARPELASNVGNLGEYDVIFLGYPNWWGDMPMILYTFLESNDLSGKTIVPFNTHGGSGFSNTISTIARLQPNAKVERDGFSVSRDRVHNCADDVVKWIKQLNID